MLDEFRELRPLFGIKATTDKLRTLARET